MKEYLLDKQFLQKLDYLREKETYVRIISLSNNDMPREEIIGRATGGSINIDGASAVRRSCSLSILCLGDENLLTDAYWCYNNKFKLEIGIKNSINSNYPDIIWFEMGIYIITSFSKSKSTNSLSVSISGKDKMCRLNGEVSGNIMMSTDFGTIEETIKVKEKDTDTGKTKDAYHTTITKLPIYTIIQNALKEYGQERAENIIINDLDQWGYELWEYRGEKPMYLFIDPTYNNNQGAVINMTFNGDTIVDIVDDGYYAPGCGEGQGNEKKIVLSDLGTDKTPKPFKLFSMNTLDKDYNADANQIYWGKSVMFSDQEKDKIKKCYVAKIEYGETAGYHQIPLIYNNDLILNAGETVTSLLDKIKNMLGDFEYFYDLQGRFVFQKKNTYIQELFSPIDGELKTPTMYASQYSYRFDDESLFTAISNSPNINNLKNDFSIWGVRKSATGDDLPIHARYAIDKKPTHYKSLDWKDKDGSTKETGKDYTTNDFDWREIIYRMAIDFYRHNQEADFLLNLETANPEFIDGITGYEQYYSDLQGFWRQLYNPLISDNDKLIAEAGGFKYYTSGKNKYWNKQIHLDPNTLNFWFDFLDTQGDFEGYSVKKAGDRSKVVNENSVKSIYFRETPEILFIVAPKENSVYTQMAYMPIWIQDNMEGLFYKSTQSISAIDKANELIYQHTANVEGISLTSIPIYYLQPNTRIYVQGYGDYTLDKITYSLNYNGTMSLSGNKIMKQFY